MRDSFLLQNKPTVLLVTSSSAHQIRDTRNDSFAYLQSVQYCQYYVGYYYQPVQVYANYP